jgi:hypothetical protein
MNALLSRLDRGLASQVPPPARAEYRRLVAAGAKQLLGKAGQRQIVEHCKARDDLPQQAALLAASVPELYFPPHHQVAVAYGAMAAFALMAKVLDLAERECGHAVTPELIEAATKATADAILARMHLSVATITAAAAQLGEKGGANA